MRFDPKITFHVAGHPQPLVPESRLWNMPLAGKGGHDTKDAEWTVGDYLEAARAFLIRDQGQMVCRAVEQLSGTHGPVRTMVVSLEKHGAFYHPLRITPTTGSGTVTLVLNGAVIDPGFTLVETEYRLLARLGKEVSPCFIPRVFGTGVHATEKGAAGFFLGEWFDGFYEFHVTRTAHDDQVAVWKDDGTHDPIPWHQAETIYENIARVLTAYYDVDTGHEIFPWHHAAGDFVTDTRGEVRLITVRGMGLLTEMPFETSDGEVKRLFRMLFYFLNLTLCMRLDRLDGTGPLVWLPERVLNATVRGMYRSLTDSSVRRSGTRDLSGPWSRFVTFARRFDPQHFYDIMTHLLEDRHFSAAEAELIRKNLALHCARIGQILAQY